MTTYKGPERRRLLIQQAQLRSDVRPFCIGCLTLNKLAANEHHDLSITGDASAKHTAHLELAAIIAMSQGWALGNLGVPMTFTNADTMEDATVPLAQVWTA